MERPEDLKILADQILLRIAGQHKVAGFELSPEALQKLKSYSWPGNVRELENILERAAAFSETSRIGVEDIKFGKKSASNQIADSDKTTPGSGNLVNSLVGMSLEDIERRAIIETLEHCQGNRNKAAEMLGVSLKSVYNKVKKFGIEI